VSVGDVVKRAVEFPIRKTGSRFSIRTPPIGDWAAGAVTFRVLPSAAASVPAAAGLGDRGEPGAVEQAQATERTRAVHAAVVILWNMDILAAGSKRRPL
jgi:hypothetical protein